MNSTEKNDLILVQMHAVNTLCIRGIQVVDFECDFECLNLHACIGRHYNRDKKSVGPSMP